MSDQVNIWQVQPRNYVNGPGCRFVVWVQGCHLACPECWNKHTWSFGVKNMVDIDSLFGQIAATDGISGVTFSGGEPLAQARNLYKLACRVKGELGLNLQVFTGYDIGEAKGKYQKLLWEMADVVVSGRFDPNKENNNQKVHEAEDIKWQFNNTDVEVEISDRGEVTLTGYPSDKLVGEIQEAVK